MPENSLVECWSAYPRSSSALAAHQASSICLVFRLSFAPHFLEAVVLCSAILVTESGCVSCFLLCQEAQNLLVVLVEPVLMLLSRVAKHRLCSAVDCISERRPGSLKIIVCLRVGRQVASQGILEGILHLRFTELFSRPASSSRCGLDGGVYAPAENLPCTEAAHGSRPSHGPCDEDVPYVTAPSDDVVYEAPVLRVWVHPGDLVDFWLLEEGVGNGEALL